MGFSLSRLKLGAFGVLAALTTSAAPLMAQEITLTALDESISMSGQLVSYEDGFFTIATTLGNWRIEAKGILCEGEGCPVEELGAEIMLAGSSTIGNGLMPLLLTGFADTQNAQVEFINTDTAGVSIAELVGNQGFGDPLANFTVSSTNSSAAFAALLDPDVQIGMSSRRILPAEARRISRAGGGNMIDPTQEHVIAVDSVVIIVNRANAIQAISLADLDRIFSGQVTNWSQLGGANAPIVAYGRESGSGLGTAFDQAVFAASGRRLSNGVVEMGSDQEMSGAVNGDLNGIGFVSFAFLGGAKPLDILGDCGIVTSPDAFTSKAEEYPLQRRLYLYNRLDNLNDVSQEFINFTQSTDADGVIAKSGFISLSVARDPREYQGGRVFDLIRDVVDPAEVNLMREMVVEALQYDRLSTTFRFASGSSSLEAKAIADLERLMAFINETQGEVEISFVGFSDSDGSFEANRALSVGRAQQVAVSVAAFAEGRITNPNGVTFTSQGYGELAPVACNTSLNGKRTNRRVEVWVRAR